MDFLWTTSTHRVPNTNLQVHQSCFKSQTMTTVQVVTCSMCNLQIIALRSFFFFASVRGLTTVVVIFILLHEQFCKINSIVIYFVHIFSRYHSFKLRHLNIRLAVCTFHPFSHLLFLDSLFMNVLFFTSSHSNFILMTEFLWISRTIFFYLHSNYFLSSFVLSPLIRPLRYSHFLTLYLIILLHFLCNCWTCFYWALFIFYKFVGYRTIMKCHWIGCM